MTMPRKRALPDIPDHRPTPEAVFFNRRTFMKAAAAAVVAPAACAQQGTVETSAKLTPPLEWPDGFEAARNQSIALPPSVGKGLTPRDVAASHNNFYELLFGRGGPVWKYAGDFTVDPWTVEVSGECTKPTTIGLDELFAFEHEERLYHFRCVERWAMNVPWTGFPLRTLLERVEPTGNANYVRFVSAYKPEQMPGLNSPGAASYEWPYQEALRMDEAMHDLAFVATGVYGKPLLKQHGAPIRIAVPWKYGYKNPKSIVKIELTREKPETFWSRPPYQHEYGFLSNVNPNIPHPRWSQARSYWLDSRDWFETPIFNGYAEHVARLYPDEPRTPQEPLRRGQTAR
jgi:sulfoxide reductase catalytic subunit YedY